MSYLEELLPKFRKGAKIRRSNWPEGHCVKLDTNKGFTVDNNNKIYTIYAEELLADNWELYKELEPEPDWDSIIKNKCLCWFWDDDTEEPNFADRLLAVVKNESGIKYLTKSKVSFAYCRPVRRDEVTFYKEEEEN